MAFRVFFEKPPLFHLNCFHSLCKAPFVNLHQFLQVIYSCQLHLPTRSPHLCLFTWFLHVSYRPPFFIYKFFTCFLQAPFSHLYVFYRSPFLIYMFLTGHFFFHFHVFLHSPFFIYKILQGFKHSVSRLFVAFGRIIYTFFTQLSKAIHMFFFTTEDTVKVRRILAVLKTVYFL